MRILLIITVVVAVTVLLWGSWQAGRRPFYLTLAGVAVAGSIFIITMLFTDQERRQTADPATVTATVESVRKTENTYRLTGEISNEGEHAMARAVLRAEALQCEPAQACDVLYSQQVRVSMHVSSGGRYPLALSVDRPEPDVEADRWRLRVEEVEVYGR